MSEKNERVFSSREVTLRELTADELRFIHGGAWVYSGDGGYKWVPMHDDPDKPDTLPPGTTSFGVVTYQNGSVQYTARTNSETSNVLDWTNEVLGATDYSQYDIYFDSGSSGGISLDGFESHVSDYIADQDIRMVTLSFSESLLTAQERLAVDAFKAKIIDIESRIMTLDPNAYIKVSDQLRPVLRVTPDIQYITGAQLKAMWLLLDFEIMPKGTVYPNGKDSGEAVYNNGNPIMRTNIDTIEGYWLAENSKPGSLDYLILHDFSHVTLLGDWVHRNTTYDTNEKFANSFAEALGSLIGLDPAQHPTGYLQAPLNISDHGDGPIDDPRDNEETDTPYTIEEP